MPDSNETILDSVKSFDFTEPVIGFISDKFSNFGDIIWFIFYAVLAFWIIYSIIMLYHWLQYSFHSKMIVAAMILYFAISFIFISAMFYSASVIF